MNQVLKFATYLALIVGAIAGEILVGSIAKYVSCIMKMLTAISGLVKTVQLAAANNTYMKRYFSYFDIPNNMYQGTLTVEKRDDVEYYVEFRDVSFKYPNTDTYALRHVNLKFKIGEKLAVVGMNGSGKTTFIKQAQKIALARALYKDAPFIVLDEPTAALDPVAEYEVYSKFNEIAGEKTTLYISHRLASCRFCDEILVFDSGSIVQHGSHEKLVADKEGKYFLWHAQAQYYTL